MNKFVVQIVFRSLKELDVAEILGTIATKNMETNMP
jgi:hypothetical protein